MKPCSIQWGALALLSFAFAGNAAEIRLQSPLDYQVFQRSARDKGSVRLAGSVDRPASQGQYRIIGKGRDGKSLADGWRDFSVQPEKEAEGENFNFTATVPAGGWYRLEMRAMLDGKTIAEASIEHVGVGEVFVVAGQSNAGSYGEERQRVKSGLVSSFDGRTWVIADDPQRGAGGEGGSFMPAFGDAMAQRFGVPIAIVPAASGGTSVRQWLPKGVKFAQQTTTGGGIVPTADGQWESNGVLFQKLTQRLTALGPGGCRAILWHQGESDVGQTRGGAPADRQITGGQYAGFMETLIRASRETGGWSMPWFSAQTTYHSETDPSDEEFRAAEKVAWDKGLSIPGPDTDTLRAEFRKGVHFNARGLQKHGELWVEKVAPWLDIQLSGGNADAPTGPTGR